MSLKSKLRAVFKNYPPKRYLPRAIQGGPAWKVWDVKQDKFLTDKEIRAIPLQEIKTDTVTQ
jgi:hypothetical protein